MAATLTPHPSPTPVPAPPKAARPERGWQTHLIELLARLELWRLQLEAARTSTELESVLAPCELIVHAIEELATRTEFAPELADAQMDALGKGGGALAAIADARGPNGRRLLQTMLVNQAAITPDAAPFPILELTLDALQAYCALFTAHYPSRADSRDWVDAASVFLADFRQTTRPLPVD